MRISTSWMQQQAVNSILDQQTSLARTQQQIASGHKILAPSDDPSGAARALDLTHASAQLAQYTRNVDTANSRLSLEENSLTSANDVLQRVRTLALQGNTASQTNATRGDIAQELRQRLTQLVQLANSQDADGEYLFAGYSTRTQPFTQSGASVSYAGDQGQRVISVGPGETVATGDPGSSVFQQIPTGNGTFQVGASGANNGTLVAGATTVTNLSAWDGGTYSIQFTAPNAYQVLDSSNAVVSSGTYASGAGTIAFRGVQLDFSGTPATGDSFTVSPSSTRDVFATIDDLASALETPVANGSDLAALNERINRALDNLDQASNRLLETQAGVGARMNVLDQQKNVNAGTSLQLSSTLSSVQDVDYASAISTLNLQATSLQAAQQSFVKAQGLSLFNFLR